MRDKSEVLLILALAAFATTGVTAVGMLDGDHETPGARSNPAPVVQATTNAAEWFSANKQYCNPVEVETRMRWQPAPESHDGQMYAAACYALSGRLDAARGTIEALPRDLRYRAAGVVFNAGHPAADAGDELAAGPLMELVVEYWPNHYMALYHAGAAAFERADYGPAWHYLERFLEEYSVEDGWRANAERMLETMKVIDD